MVSGLNILVDPSFDDLLILQLHCTLREGGITFTNIQRSRKEFRFRRTNEQNGLDNDTHDFTNNDMLIRKK